MQDKYLLYGTVIFLIICNIVKFVIWFIKLDSSKKMDVIYSLIILLTITFFASFSYYVTVYDYNTTEISASYYEILKLDNVNVDKEMKDGKITEREYYKIMEREEEQERDKVKKSMMKNKDKK